MSIGITFPYDLEHPDRFSPSFDGNSLSNSDRVITVQYGDGYAKYIRDGANWKKEKFTYSWKNVPFTDLAELNQDIETPDLGNCTGMFTEIPVGNVLYSFFQKVRTITPFNFQLPKVNRSVQVRCTGIKFEFPTFYTCDISVDMETDFTLE